MKPDCPVELCQQQQAQRFAVKWQSVSYACPCRLLSLLQDIAVQHGSCCCTFHLHDKPLLRGPTPLCQLQLNFFVWNPFDFETKFMTIVVIYNARPVLYCRYWMRCVC